MDTQKTSSSEPSEDAVRVSVCMATYDGARFLREQLDSILSELGPRDEVVVVDDASHDDTVSVLRDLGDSRIRVVESPLNRGYVRTFEAALTEARGEYLLLSDQDDIWVPGRVALMLAALEHSDVVATNLGTLAGSQQIRGPYGQSDWRLRSSQSGHRVRNIAGVLAGNRPYYGCAMGVHRETLERLMPFPTFLVESHDLWVALYGNLVGSIAHLDERTVQRRFHGENVTPDRPRGVVGVLRSRFMLVRATVELWRRVRASVRRPTRRA